MLYVIALGAALAAPDCPEQVALPTLEASLERAAEAAARRDVGGFRTAYGRVARQLVCMGEVVSPGVAWEVYAQTGLYAELLSADASAAFAGAREILPDRPPPAWMGSPPNPLHTCWTAAASVDARWEEVAVAPYALVVDGRRSKSRPTGRLALVQVLEPEGDVLLTTLVRPGGALPDLPEPPAPPPIPPPGPGTTDALVVRLDHGVPVDLAAQQRAFAAASGRPVVLRPDHDVTWIHVHEVQRIAEEAGLEVSVDPVDPAVRLFAELPEAQALGTVSTEDLARFRPRQSRLPQNPYGNTDYTAYTLEWGEAKIGVESVSLGVAPRVQIGTSPVLDGFGVFNGHLKANVLREGPMDLAVVANIGWIPIADLLERFDLLEQNVVDDLLYVNLGGRWSLRLAEPWSLHANVNYRRVSAKGDLDMSALPALLFPNDEASGGALDDATIVSQVNGDLLGVRLVTDIRLNRRDAILLMGEVQVVAVARAGAELQTDAVPGGLDLLLAYGGVIRPVDSYSAAVAWQLTWPHLEARVGLGLSAIPYMWATGAFNLAYRFGGATRGEARRMRSGWRDNRRDVRRGDVE